MIVRTLRAVVLVLVALSLAAPATAGDEFAAGLEAWKQWRADRLRRPDGWLTLVGLSWLHEGDNLVGADPAATVRLPAGKAPARLGTLRVEGAKASFAAAPGVTVSSAGQPVSSLALADDATGSGPTALEHGTLSFFVIRRAGRLGVRVKDAEAETLRQFRGLDYFPADPAWSVEGRFEAAPPGSTLEVPNALGFSEEIAQPGRVSFELGGATHRLIALDDTGDGRLFLVFGDRSNGRETYGGGRFLYTDPPRDGRVIIDFNRAYNPPCVFTPYATCPLPPPGNKLPLPILAGEKVYAGVVHRP